MIDTNNDPHEKSNKPTSQKTEGQTEQELKIGDRPLSSTGSVSTCVNMAVEYGRVEEITKVNNSQRGGFTTGREQQRRR